MISVKIKEKKIRQFNLFKRAYHLFFFLLELSFTNQIMHINGMMIYITKQTKKYHNENPELFIIELNIIDSINLILIYNRFL
jgi:hypothetical protein